MAEKIVLRLSRAGAEFLRPDIPRELKLRVIAADIPMSPLDRITVLYFLAHDLDPEVREISLQHIRDIQGSELMGLSADVDLHPRIIDLLARLFVGNMDVSASIAENPATEAGTLAFLAELGIEAAVNRLFEQDALAYETANGEEGEADEDGEVDEESKEYQSKYQLAQSMPVAEKIKAALTGDKEWRNILIKDSNKLVSAAVIKNPRITDGEVLNIAKAKIQNDEIIRVICMNREWIKKYAIRRALAENTRTPLPQALRFVATLADRDLAALAKSKNVQTVIATQARKILLAKQKK